MKALIAAAAIAIASPAQATEFLLNGELSGPEATTSLNGIGIPGPAAAPRWSLWNNSGQTTTSVLLANFGGRSNVLQITTDGEFNGLFQVFFGGWAHYSWADVWVESGQVGLMAAVNGAVIAQTDTQSTGAWEQLSLQTGSDPFNQVVLYSVGGPANFYVDSVSASDAPTLRAAAEATAAVPEPATWATMILGFAAIGFAMRQRKAAGPKAVRYSFA